MCDFKELSDRSQIVASMLREGDQVSKHDVLEGLKLGIVTRVVENGVYVNLGKSFWSTHNVKLVRRAGEEARRTGDTTRRIDKCIQAFFDIGVVDLSECHRGEYGIIERAVINRLALEHHIDSNGYSIDAARKIIKRL